MKIIEKIKKKIKILFFIILHNDVWGMSGNCKKCSMTLETRFTKVVILRQNFQVFGEKPVQMIWDFPDFPEIHLSLGPPISELKRS